MKPEFVFTFKGQGIVSIQWANPDLLHFILSILGQNTKRESGRKVQSGNINAAKVAYLLSSLKFISLPPPAFPSIFVFVCY